MTKIVSIICDCDNTLLPDAPSLLLKNNGMYINKIIKDLSGKDRCIVSTKLNK